MNAVATPATVAQQTIPIVESLQEVFPKWYSFRVLTTEQAANKLKISRRRVLALIKSGKLKATQFGRAWVVDPKDLAAVRVRRPGRPPRGP
jgi:excisionase family DNA binding protein